MLEKDVNFMDDMSDAVTVNWTVWSAALAVTTTTGFSRSEFYHFSKSKVDA